MSTIKATFGEGGGPLVPTGTTASPTLTEALRDIADDLAAIRAAFVGLTAKLDADAGVTDTDYAASLDPAALKTIKG